MIHQIFNNDTVLSDMHKNHPKLIKRFLLKTWFRNRLSNNHHQSAVAKKITNLIINKVVPTFLTTYKVPPNMLRLIHILIHTVTGTTICILNSLRILISTPTIHSLPDILKLLCLWCLTTILISIMCHNRTYSNNLNIIMTLSSKWCNRISSQLTKDWKEYSPSSQTKCSRYKII